MKNGTKRSEVPVSLEKQKQFLTAVLPQVAAIQFGMKAQKPEPGQLQENA